MTAAEIEKQIFEKMRAKDFGESMCNETKRNVLRWVMQQLRLYDVISSCVDKDELISDLDDRRAVGVEMNEDMWYFCRKQSAEYLLDKYKILRK